MNLGAPGLFERRAVILSLISFTLLVLADIFWLHPGFCAIDEVHVIRFAWEVAQGNFSNLSMGTGSLARLLSGLFMRLQPPHLAAPQLATLVVFLAECWLLWTLVRRFFGESAAAGALIFNLLCAFSLVRARSILSYSVMPCELLITFHLILKRPAWQRFLGGLFAGLCLLDYEAWMVGGWLLVLMLIFGQGRRENLNWRPATLGLAAGMGLVLSLSFSNLPSYFNLRMATASKGSEEAGVLPPLARSLLGLFWGGESLPSLGARMHATLPPWSWAVLALGSFRAWKSGRWVLVWAGLGCLLLLPRSGGLNESNRSVLAWPAFCILAGLGWSELLLRLPTTRKSVITGLGLLLCLAGAWEARAFVMSQDYHDPGYYAQSRAMRDAAKWIEAESHNEPLKLLSNLGYWPMTEIQWLSSHARLEPGARRVVAVIPYECLIALQNSQANEKIRIFVDPKGGRPSYLYEPSQAWKARLVHADGALAAIWNRLPRFDGKGTVERLEKLLADPEFADAWIQSSLWWRLMVTASMSGSVDQNMMDRLEKAKLLHAGPLYSPSVYLQKYNADYAARLRVRAARIDTRISLSW